MAVRATKKNKEKFIEIFIEKRCNIKATCLALNISRWTYYDWCKRDDEFKKAVEEVQEGLIDDAESALGKMIESKNVAAVIFFLKTRGKSRGYVEHQSYDVYRKELPTIQLVEPTPEDIEKFHNE